MNEGLFLINKKPRFLHRGPSFSHRKNEKLNAGGQHTYCKTNVTVTNFQQNPYIIALYKDER